MNTSADQGFQIDYKIDNQDRALLLFLCGLIVSIYSLCLTDFFAYGDDYFYTIWWEGRKDTVLDFYTSAGRFLSTLLFFISWLPVDSVYHLWIPRLASMVGVMVVSCLLYWSLRRFEYPRLFAFIYGFLVSILPSVILYISWAAVSVCIFGIIPSLFAYLLSNRSLQADSKFYKFVYGSGAIVLQTLGLMFYQPSGMFFPLMFLFQLPKIKLSISELTKTAFHHLVVFLSGTFLGILPLFLMRYFGLSVSQRVGLVVDIPSKIYWFLSEPLSRSLAGLFFINETKTFFNNHSYLQSVPLSFCIAILLWIDLSHQKSKNQKSKKFYLFKLLLLFQLFLVYWGNNSLIWLGWIWIPTIDLWNRFSGSLRIRFVKVTSAIFAFFLLGHFIKQFYRVDQLFWIPLFLLPLLLVGWFITISGELRERFYKSFILCLIIPTLYLPNLLAKEDNSDYRTLILLAMAFLFIAMHLVTSWISAVRLPKKNQSKVVIFATLCIVIFGTILTRHHLYAYFILPNEIEWRFLRSELSASLQQNQSPSEIYFVMPSYSSYELAPTAEHEFGTTSLSLTWVVEPMVELALDDLIRKDQRQQLRSVDFKLLNPYEPIPSIPNSAWFIDGRKLSSWNMKRP